MKKHFIIFISCCLVMSYSPKCKAQGRMSSELPAESSTGGVIGEIHDNSADGILIKNSIGGSGGAVIGKYMDEQTRVIENEIEDVKTERIAEGIKITFNTGVLFAFNDSKLKYLSENNLKELAIILKRFNNTKTLIEEFSGKWTEQDNNLKLSEKRNANIAGLFIQQGVNSNRIMISKYREMPLEANYDTTTLIQLNQKVVIVIYANKKLRKAAARGLMSGY